MLKNAKWRLSKDLMKARLNAGDTVYEISPSNTISEWIVKSVSKSGLFFTYTLTKKDGDSFCTYDSSSLGKDIFKSADNAVREKKRREK